MEHVKEEKDTEPPMETRWEAFDVLKGILANLDKGVRVPTSQAVLQAAICELAENPKYERFFSEYRFSRKRYFPFARALEIDLTNMQLSGLLSMTGLDLAEYSLEKKLATNFKLRTKNLFSDGELRALEEMAQELPGLLDKYAARYDTSEGAGYAPIGLRLSPS